jgi:hypothetical protein
MEMALTGQRLDFEAAQREAPGLGDIYKSLLPPDALSPEATLSNTSLSFALS